MADDRPIRVRKVSPYPFEIVLLKAEGTPPIRAQVLKLSELGVIVRVTQPTFMVGERWILRFELPVFKVNFNLYGKVVKTYDAVEMIEGKQVVKGYMIECHFLDLDEVRLSAVRQFCRAIGQVSK